MTLKERIKLFISESVENLYHKKTDMIPILYPEQKEHGDYSTTVSMVLARELKKNPKEIAQALSDELSKRPEFKKVEIAGPGYINMFLSDSFLNAEIKNMITDKNYGRNEVLKGEKILLEFVSANPTGPLHIGHGRWAAIGDSMAKILSFCGADVSTEFYINDAGNQMNLLYESVEAVKQGKNVPENGYHGAYINDIAKMEDDPAQNLLKIQQKTLSDFRVHFDNYFSEKTLHNSGFVKETLEALGKTPYRYEHEGAIWLKTTEFGDDKDRVLVKSGGEFTYFAVDIAYHRNKVSRGFNNLINVLGADHHGYVKRLEAAVKIFAEEIKHKVGMKIIIGQLVSLYRDGEPVRMSKRTGDMITLQEVMEEIGIDASRYFMVMRKADTPLEFDIEIAKKQSDDNPVFYVQYAFARISGILRNYTESLENIPQDILDSGEARDLAIELVKFPEVTADAGSNLEPHRIPQYLENLAGVFHRFYHHHRVISEDKSVTSRRIQMVNATKQIISQGMSLIGVSAPERM